MLRGLFVNATILVSFLFIVGQCFKEYELHHNSSYRIKFLAGIIAGVLGSSLVFFSVQITSALILDFRQLALVIVSIYGGLFSTLIAGLIIGCMCIAYFGFSITSLSGFVIALIIAIGCGLISKTSIREERKWLYMIVYCLVVFVGVNYMILKEFHILSKVFIPYAFGMCILAFVAYYCSRYITISNRIIRQLKEASTQDFLTGLNNVRNFNSLFNNAIRVACQKNENMSIILIDIDFFKKVNDTYGHPSGDAVLKEMGLLISKSCRSSDIVSRNGGEEFSVILSNCSAELAIEIGERIRSFIQSHSFILPNGEEIQVTVSVGVSAYPDTTKDFQSLIQQADSALYKAKSLGRNRVCLA